MTIVLTGSTGFIGKALIKELMAQSYQVKAILRQPSEALPKSVEQVVIDDLTNLSDKTLNRSLLAALEHAEVLIHAAARVHIMKDRAANPLDEFRKINRDSTLVLARLAAASGVKRFIFISSIKVNGDFTVSGEVFRPDDLCSPNDPYGISKYEAEKGLLALANETKMDVVIIRPPLVYGVGVKGNFSSLINWMRKPLPLPFGAINNLRSFLALDNLISFIALCVDLNKSRNAGNQIFLISDDEDVSTTKLLETVGQVLKSCSPSRSRALLFPVPIFLMSYIARFLGKRDIANRLFGSLQIDNSKAKNLLGWKPVINMKEQLSKMLEDNRRL